MKKLTNDPSRNVNAVSGMWVRLRKDGSKYDVRYVNARVRRVWSLSQTSQGTAWNVQAKGVQYEDFLNGMRSSSVDLEHGWMLIPDSERMKTVPVPVPTGMDAKTVGGIVAHPSIDANWKCEEERFTSNVQWPVPMPEDAILEDEFMDDEPAPDTQEIPEVMRSTRARSITSVGVSGIGCLVGPIARRWKAAILRSSPILTHFARWSIPTMAVWPSLPPIDSCRPVFSSLPPDGIPFLTKYGI